MTNSASSTTPVVAQGAGSGMPRLAAVTASSGKMTRHTPAAVVAPSSCATTYAPASGGAMRPVTRKPAVTAGLKCAPDSPPNTFTAMESARPCASAMPRSPDIPPTAGVLLRIAAMPAKQR